MNPLSGHDTCKGPFSVVFTMCIVYAYMFSIAIVSY